MNISECIHKFHEGAESGKSGNVSFRDGVLYSYRMPIAWRREGKPTLVRSSRDSPSVTTTSHISAAGRADVLRLPGENEVLKPLGLRPEDFQDSFRIRHLSDYTDALSGYIIKREGKEDSVLMDVYTRTIKVPHYHQLDAHQPSFWMRAKHIPTSEQVLNMWRFMLKNPPRRRVQRRIQKAFEEDRLAQSGLCLLERVPDYEVSDKRWAARGSSKHVPGTPLDGTPNRIYGYDRKDPEYFKGCWNERLINDRDEPVRVLTGFVPLIQSTDEPVSFWDQPVYNPRRSL